MDEVEFCRWLQGFCELQEDNTPPNKAQWVLIKEHLQLVYIKITSDLDADNIQEESWRDVKQNIEDAMNESWDKEHKNKKGKKHRGSGGPFCSSIPERADLLLQNICCSAPEENSEKFMAHGLSESSPNCPKCDSSPDKHKVENYDMIWHDGDVVCTECGTKVRNYDAG